MVAHFSKADFVGVEVGLHDALTPDIEISGSVDDLDISVHLSGSNERVNYRLFNGNLTVRGDAADRGGFEKFTLGSSMIFLERAHLQRLQASIDTDNRSEVMFHDQVGWTGNRASVMAINVAGQDVVVASRHGMSGFATFSMNQDGALSPLSTMADTAQSYAADVHLMASTVIGGKTFLFTASQSESGISSYEIGQDHSITFQHSLGAAEYVGLNAPSTMMTVNVGGNDFLLVGDAGLGAIKVFGVTPTGQLSEVSTLLDNLNTRFANISALNAIEINGKTYVLAGGSDDGLSLFVLSAGGKLIELDTIEDTNVMGLTNITDLELRADGNDIHVFVTSEVTPGLTHLEIDTSSTGELLEGGAGAEQLIGGAKDDVFLDGAGQDTMTGGAGADLFVLSQDGARDTITDFDMTKDKVNLSAWPSLHSAFQLTFTETSTGAIVTYGAEELVLHSANNTPITFVELVQSEALGLPQSYLSGKDANLYQGHDNLTGTSVTDNLFGFAGNDLLKGVDGKDRLFGGEGNDTLVGGAGADELDGGDGRDLVSYAQAGARVNLDLRAKGTSGEARGDSFISVEDVEGSNFDDYIYGNDVDNMLKGGSGADRLRGHTGDDTLIGGSGADDLNGGSGNDTVSYVNAGSKVNLDLRSRGTYGDAKNDTFTSIENVQGSNYGDYIYGTDAHNTLNGGAGADRLRGHNGDDILIGGAGADDLNGGSGRDTASYADAGGRVNLDLRSRGTYGDASNDTFTSIENVIGSGYGDYIYGTDAHNILNGGAGADRLRGHNGDDVLIGGAGADDLNGGTGRDTASYAMRAAG